MLKWTFILIIACTVVFILQLTGIFDWRYLEFTPSLAFSMPWTFVTSIFMHADITHLLVNMLVLFFMGLALENRVGSKHFVILFFLAGIFGSVGYMITATDPSVPAIGASGAINGLVGALTVVMPLMMVWIWGIVPMPMIAVAVIWALIDFFGVFTPDTIAHGAHLGGLFVGLLYGWYLRNKLKKESRIIRVRYLSGS
ncbi:MAG: rhomboid family intramembrane serine protease [Candidatus Helarchaeota archaeon]|nr:rhomboid family intramembrane serine protease [Candidatus Helarchaeota archaeon]